MFKSNITNTSLFINRKSSPVILQKSLDLEFARPLVHLFCLYDIHVQLCLMVDLIIHIREHILLQKACHLENVAGQISLQNCCQSSAILFAVVIVPNILEISFSLDCLHLHMFLFCYNSRFEHVHHLNSRTISCCVFLTTYSDDRYSRR